MAALRKNKSLLAKLTDEDVRAWQELRRPRPPFPYGEGVSITLRIGAPRFPVDRVLIHLEEELLLAKFRLDDLWMEGCRLGRQSLTALNVKSTSEAESKSEA